MDFRMIIHQKLPLADFLKVETKLVVLTTSCFLIIFIFGFKHVIFDDKHSEKYKCFYLTKCHLMF